MTAQEELQHAIQLMQEGRAELAADKLDRLIDRSDLDARGRSAACVWLAEARDDRDFKIHCLQRALTFDPENAQILQGLDRLQSERPKPPHLPARDRQGENAVQLERAPQVVGIHGGANGWASGVFINREGLLATTSYAVGSAEAVSIAIDGARQVSGRVIRRYPLFDLALITTPVRLEKRLAVAPPAALGTGKVISAWGYHGIRLRAALTRDEGSAASHWLATTILPIQMPDAGGNPLYDDQGQLLGILTRNLDRAGNAYAIKATFIRTLADQLGHDRQLMPDVGYCPCCGALTRAQIFGGRSCETCGARLTRGDRLPYVPPQTDKLLQLHGETQNRPCPNCAARVGFYRDRCLRCGSELARVDAPGS